MSRIHTVLVTGASGYIGGQTVLALADAGHQVIGVDLNTPSSEINSVCDYFYECDFVDLFKTELSNILLEKNVTAIVHCAGTSLVGPSILSPAVYFENNFIKTKHLADYLVETGLTRIPIIFSSSAAVYGEPIMNPCQEEDPPAPISPYGHSKLMAEIMLESYRIAYGLNYVAFRYFNACGADPKQRHGQMLGATHIIARAIESIKISSTFTLNGNTYSTPDGSCVRDYVHVHDIANAHVMAIEKSVPSGVYNLGTSTGFSNLEVLAAVEQVTNNKVMVEVGPVRPGDPEVLTANPAKFNSLTGWKTTYTLTDIVEHAWKWYNK